MAYIGISHRGTSNYPPEMCGLGEGMLSEGFGCLPIEPKRSRLFLLAGVDRFGTILYILW